MENTSVNVVEVTDRSTGEAIIIEDAFLKIENDPEATMDIKINGEEKAVLISYDRYKKLKAISSKILNTEFSEIVDDEFENLLLD